LITPFYFLVLYFFLAFVAVAVFFADFFFADFFFADFFFAGFFFAGFLLPNAFSKLSAYFVLDPVRRIVTVSTPSCFVCFKNLC